MPKRLLLAAVLLVAAVVAIAVWGHRASARGSARTAPVHQDAAVPSTLAPTPAHDTPSAARLFGRVAGEGTGNPVAGAAISAYAFETGLQLDATSSADGSFDFPDASAAGRTFHLVARHGSSGAASLRAVLSDRPVLIRLSATGTLRGRVISAQGHTPVTPCRVSIVRCRAEDEPWDPHAALHRQLLPVALAVEATTSTRADGSFEASGLRPGPYALLVAAEGFAPRSVGDWNSKERVEIRAGAVTEVEVALPGTAPFLVDVTDEETGEPLDSVRFEQALRAEHWTTFVPVPAEARHDGAYELRAGYDGEDFEWTWLRVSREGYAPQIAIFAGQKEGYRFSVALGRGAAILGRVRASGEPAPGCLVLVEQVSRVVGAAVTGPDGAFEIGTLAAGEELAVHAYDRTLDPIAVVTLTLEDGEERVVEIGSPATAIEGRVVVLGKQAANAIVRISGTGDSVSAATGPDGNFCLEGLGAGRHEVEVFADEAYFRRFVELAEGKRTRLDIDASLVIAGVVVDAGTGMPLADAADLQLEVYALPVGADGSSSTRIDRDGRFRLAVEAGAYELAVPDAEEVYEVERPRVDVAREAAATVVTLRVARDPKDGKIVLDMRDATSADAVPDGEYEYEYKITHGWGSFESGNITEERLSLGTHRFRIWSDAHVPTNVAITLTLERRAVSQTVNLKPAQAVRIADIRRGGAGWVAGLKTGDVILACNGKATPGIAALNNALAEARGPVAIDFERAGDRKLATLAATRIEAELENVLLGR